MSLIDITLSCLLSRLNNNNLVLQGLHERSKNRHISFQTWPYSAKQTTVLTRTFSVKKRPPLFGDPFVYIDLYIYIYICYSGKSYQHCELLICRSNHKEIENT